MEEFKNEKKEEAKKPEPKKDNFKERKLKSINLMKNQKKAKFNMNMLLNK